MDHLDLGQLIGEGGFASVFKAFDRSRQSDVAVKCVDKHRIQDLHLLSRIENEISIHSLLDHPNIVRAFSSHEDDDSIYMVLELCEGGNLFRYLKRRQILHEVEAVFIIQQILQAIGYLHDQGLVHRDLKLSNVLIDNIVKHQERNSNRNESPSYAQQYHQDASSPLSSPSCSGLDLPEESLDNMRSHFFPKTAQGSVTLSSATTPTYYEFLHVKLCDFGLTVHLQHPDEEHYTLCGTPNYIAPEIVSQRGVGHGTPADIWSVGALFYTLRLGKPLLEAQETQAWLSGGVKDRERAIRRVLKVVDEASNEVLSPDCKDFLRQIFQSDPKVRPTVRDILRHPLLQKYNTVFQQLIKRIDMYRTPDRAQNNTPSSVSSSGRRRVRSAAAAVDLSSVKTEASPYHRGDARSSSLPQQQQKPKQDLSGQRFDHTSSSHRTHRYPDMQPNTTFDERETSTTEVQHFLHQQQRLAPPSSSSTQQLDRHHHNQRYSTSHSSHFSKTAVHTRGVQPTRDASFDDSSFQRQQSSRSTSSAGANASSAGVVSRQPKSVRHRNVIGEHLDPDNNPLYQSQDLLPPSSSMDLSMLRDGSNKMSNVPTTSSGHSHLSRSVLNQSMSMSVSGSLHSMLSRSMAEGLGKWLGTLGVLSQSLSFSTTQPMSASNAPHVQRHNSSATQRLPLPTSSTPLEHMIPDASRMTPMAQSNYKNTNSNDKVQEKIIEAHQRHQSGTHNPFEHRAVDDTVMSVNSIAAADATTERFTRVYLQIIAHLPRLSPFLLCAGTATGDSSADASGDVLCFTKEGHLCYTTIPSSASASRTSSSSSATTLRIVFSRSSNLASSSAASSSSTEPRKHQRTATHSKSITNKQPQMLYIGSCTSQMHDEVHDLQKEEELHRQHQRDEEEGYMMSFGTPSQHVSNGSQGKSRQRSTLLAQDTRDPSTLLHQHQTLSEHATSSLMDHNSDNDHARSRSRAYGATKTIFVHQPTLSTHQHLSLADPNTCKKQVSLASLVSALQKINSPSTTSAENTTQHATASAEAATSNVASYVSLLTPLLLRLEHLLEGVLRQLPRLILYCAPCSLPAHESQSIHRHGDQQLQLLAPQQRQQQRRNRRQQVRTNLQTTSSTTYAPAHHQQPSISDAQTTPVSLPRPLGLKCLLMSNAPFPDFHAQWQDGTRLRYTLCQEASSDPLTAHCKVSLESEPSAMTNTRNATTSGGYRGNSSRSSNVFLDRPRQVLRNASSGQMEEIAAVRWEGTLSLLPSSNTTLHPRDTSCLPSASTSTADITSVPSSLRMYLLQAQTALVRCLQEDRKLSQQLQVQTRMDPNNTSFAFPVIVVDK